MKKIIYILLTTLLAAGSYSCEHELMGYEGEEGIYFAVQWGASYSNDRVWPYMPYSNVEFIKISSEETNVNLKVMVTGPIKNYDRSFSVMIAKDSTDAPPSSYELLTEQLTIPAGEYQTYVQLRIKKIPEMEVAEKTIGLQLIPNNYFTLAFTEWDAVDGYTAGTIIPHFDASYHAVKVNNFIVQPAVWPGSVNAETGADQGMWGGFTRKKLELMCEMFNLTYDSFASTSTMPSALQNLIVTVLAEYLIEMYEAGTPVLEDDGRLMCTWYVPWTSYVGVPWVPEI